MKKTHLSEKLAKLGENLSMARRAIIDIVPPPYDEIASIPMIRLA